MKSIYKFMKIQVLIAAVIASFILDFSRFDLTN